MVQYEASNNGVSGHFIPTLHSAVAVTGQGRRSCSSAAVHSSAMVQDQGR